MTKAIADSTDFLKNKSLEVLKLTGEYTKDGIFDKVREMNLGGLITPEQSSQLAAINRLSQVIVIQELFNGN